MGLHGYIDKQLTGDEVILYRARLSWVPVIAKVAAFALIGAAAFALLAALTPYVAAGAVAFAAFVLLGVVIELPAIVRNLGVDIVVTDKRIHSKRGLVTVRDDRESSLARIDDTDIDFNSFAQRLFDYGDIEIHTVGGTELIKFENVSRPRGLKRAINEAKSRYVDVPGSPGAAV